VYYLKPRILGISGSPRTSSNTAILVETALEAAKEEGAVIEYIDLANTALSAVGLECVKSMTN
jgi:multimeric flavodoxin WrbA